MIKFFISIVLLSSSLSADILPLSRAVKDQMIKRDLWRRGCPVGLDRLRLVKIDYVDFSGQSHKGEIVVLDAVAPTVQEIFAELFLRKFPLHQVKRIETFDKSTDENSMSENNTASFNCRGVTDAKDVFSLHAYGLAIDINPSINPYVAPVDLSNPELGILKIAPASGAKHLNRSKLRPGMAEHIVSLLTAKGFPIWGGNWSDPIDWQHFQTPRSLARLLASMRPNHARTFFLAYAKDNSILPEGDNVANELIASYKSNAFRFMKTYVLARTNKPSITITKND